MLAAAWAALHLLLATAVVSIGAPVPLKLMGFAAVVGHALVRRPPKPRRLVLDAAGRVAVPELGLEDLALGPRTRFTPRWVRFDLRAPAARLDVVLLADQLEPAAWSELQARLRGFRDADGNEGR